MTEIIENGIQLVTTGICTILSLRKGILLKSRAWTILALASGVFFLGDLYWELFLILYGKTPAYSYIPYLSWYASYLFLLLLLIELREKSAGWTGRGHGNILWFIPVFTAGMCVFYMQYGDWIGNIVTVVLMSPLIWTACDGLMSLREHKRNHPEAPTKEGWLCAAVLLFCLAEYAAWTSSCFGTSGTWTHPYFWFDTLLSFVFLLLPAALGKAVDG